MKIRNVIGNLVILASVIFGIWLTIWVMLAGGIMQVVNGAQNGIASDIAWGLIKAIFCEVGMIPMWIGWVVGELIKID